jgi:hypothetical protein
MWAAVRLLASQVRLLLVIYQAKAVLNCVLRAIKIVMAATDLTD